MHRITTVLLSTLSFGVLLAGCPKVQLPGGLPDLSQFTPKLRFDKLELGAIDFERADVDFVFAVDNPNPVNVKVSTFSYDLALAGTPLLAGSSEDGISLKSEGSSVLTLPVSVVFAELFAAAGALKGQTEVPFEIKGDFGFQTPLGLLKVPYTESGVFPVVKPPKVRFERVRVEGVRLLEQKASLAVDLAVSNPHGAGVGLSNFDYRLALGETQVASGLVPELASIESLEEQTVTLPVEVNLLQLGASLVTAITSKQKLPVGLDASLIVATPLGPIPLSVDESGQVQVE